MPAAPPPARPKRAPRPARLQEGGPQFAPLAELDALASLPLPHALGDPAELVPPVVSAESSLAEEAPATPVEPPAPPRYKVSLPPSAELTLDVARTDAKGTEWYGKAVMGWSQTGDAYRMSFIASITMLVTINLAELTSEGATGEAGIVPRTMTEKRRGRAQTATHFNAEQARITFSASERDYPMLHGAQDKATFPMQLAGIARADAAQLQAGVEILVGEDKDANVFRFVVVGQEEIDTRMGKLATWRLSRPPVPGSYNSRLDIWLAPDHNWYPVQLRNSEANGAITTQTIRKIVVKDAGT